MIQIKKISAEETYDVRLTVLRKNIPLPYEFNGDFEKDTFHLGAFSADKLIAVSSFMKTSNKKINGSQYQLRGMATLEAFQGLGTGKLMMEHAFKLLKGLNISYLWCNARVIAVPFYEKSGMKTIGEPYNIEFIGTHYVMVKRLN